MKWFRKAAEQYDIYGERNLGAMYQDGCGVPQDIGEAVKWFRQSVAHGNADAKADVRRLGYDE